ncbi:MAG: hypothetical protein ACU0C9_01035 [Paracoccaceae bacterium]
MSGNAMEEGLMLQIHNPSHLDPSRIGFLAGALSGFAAVLLITVILPAMPRLLTVYLAIAVTVAVGTHVTKRITSARTKRKIDSLIAARAAQRFESERQIVEMNAANG